jgi:hypothetical protein
MANHWPGYVTHRAASLADAEGLAWQFRKLSLNRGRRNVLLPVGADHVIPSRWHRYPQGLEHHSGPGS